MGVATSRSGVTVKTLVLGCMSSGKSTFMKQMLKLHRGGITQKRELYVYCLQLHLLRIFQELRRVCQSCDVDVQAFEEHLQEIEKYKHREAIPERIRTSILALKYSGLIEGCKRKQRILQLPFNYNYILTRSEDILDPEFVPNDADILMSYAETVGLNVETVCVQSYFFELIEIPGHHIWRRKWEEYYLNTNLVVFVIDLAELCDPAFYQGHLEKKTVGVFTEVVNHPLLAQVSWMLLFNKCDTFNDHSAGFDFKQLAQHTDTAETARTYYRGKFTRIVPKGRSYSHNVSLVNNSDSRTAINDLFRRVGRAHRERERQQPL